MHMTGNCGCFHHWAVKVVAVLAWVAGVLFFWTSWRVTGFWGFEAPYWAWSVVVLVLLAKVSMFCGCCHGWWGGKMMGSSKMCSHDMGCKCGDCDRCK